MRPFLAAVLAAATAALCGACRVDVGVTVEARADGSGEVRATASLDPDAVAAIGDVRTDVELDDLRAAGWDVDGPTLVEGGGAEIVASREFDDLAEARRLLTEVGGEAGPVQSFRLEQRRELLQTRTSVRGVVDLTRGLGTFSDQRLAEALGGSPLGVRDDQLAAHAGEPLERAFDLQVAVRLPGEVESNAPTEVAGGAAWPVELGERVVVEATAEQWNSETITFAALSAASTALLLGLLGFRGVRRLRRRRVTHPLSGAESSASDA